jgi:adenosylcobinamide-GDP ribazoletransferase
MPAASVRAAAGALSFLTRIPVGRLFLLDGRDVARGSVLFPAVGAGVGALTGAVAVLLYPAVPAFLAAGIAVACASLLTGAMHLDALADTADATGAHGREEALAIMRDSRIGSFGATALALDLLIKVGAVAVLLQHAHALAVLVSAGALSRAASPALAAVLPYPRAEGGPGSVLSGRTAGWAAVVGVAVTVGATLALAWNGVWLALAALATACILAVVFMRWLGGATGDALGAATELCETVVLVVAAGLA